MRRALPFVATAFLVVSSGVLLFAPFLADEGRRAIMWAGILVLGTQIPLHVLTASWRGSNERFVLAIVTGFASRLAVIVLGIVLFVVPSRVEPATFLLALGGFLVSTLFAESFLEQRTLRRKEEVTAG
ncbi:MAG: hypothetical protein HKO53_09585 [Gemmatimonadetes bacterium]|nr:hypothetical protein [Gemmatimonadota bacterium]NNM33307.1 hypothetical protein [Gemmatimonadota bacterium]